VNQLLALLAFGLSVHLGDLSLYGGLGLLLVALVTYLRVRTSPAYNQSRTQIVERPPGARLLGPPQPARPEAKKDLDFALLSQAAYDETPYAKKHEKANLRDAEGDLKNRGWSIWPEFGQNHDLPCKLQNAHLRAQVWINKQENVVAVTFGGTVVGNDKDLISNLRWFIPFDRNDEYTKTVRVFGPAFAEEFVTNIQGQMPTPSTVTIYSTGHSLGGGLAQQFAYSLPEKPEVPRVHKVFAFDPSPVTGYFSVKLRIRRHNSDGLRIDRIYERGEILAYVRSITNFFHVPSAKNPQIRQIRYNLFRAVNPFSGHSISELASKLWDLVHSPEAQALTAGPWRRPKMSLTPLSQEPPITVSKKRV
jgi:Lipase (class 3)